MNFVTDHPVLVLVILGYLLQALTGLAFIEWALKVWKSAYEHSTDPVILHWLPIRVRSSSSRDALLGPTQADRLKLWNFALTPIVQTVFLMLVLIGTASSYLRIGFIRIAFGNERRMEFWLARRL
jgi:L-asparagine transporter-like permease